MTATEVGTSRYVYSVIRYVPSPASGEFVNLGAIVGSEETGDWAVRHVENARRARALGFPQGVAAFYAFVQDIGFRIDINDWAVEAEAPSGFEELTEAWLVDLCQQQQNLVQLSRPAPITAETAEDALDLIFEHLVLDPVVQSRGYATRHRVFSALRRSYLSAGVDLAHLDRRVSLESGSLRAPLDFVVANGRALQLAQTWSFQVASHADVARDVKAWGYTVASLRAAGGVISSRERTIPVDSDVQLEVIFAPPRTTEQEAVFGEATQVFLDVNAIVRPLSEAQAIADDAASLLAQHGLLGQIAAGDV